MRRRNQNKTVSISITLNRDLLDELDDLLTIKQSRSRFIQRCIEDKLNNSGTIRDAETTQLMAALFARKDCDLFLQKMLRQILLS
tara:strand:+ start:127 stop:381 length:255 start_codon:yes stop_codon:yes gene_type:complete